MVVNTYRPRAVQSSIFGRGPALLHQVEQMLQGFLVTAALLPGQLVRALVQLRSHFTGFPGGTAERGEDLGKFGNFHRNIQPRMLTDKRG